MISRLLVFIGVVLLILGLLKFIGVLSVTAAAAVPLIVVGLILMGLGFYVFNDGGYWSRRGPRV